MGVSVRRKARPLHATPRSFARTRGKEVARVATMAGLHLMPWQRRVADTAFEVGGDGRPAFDLNVVTVCRQQGKTALIAAIILHRMLFWRRDTPQVVIYGAQTLKDGRDKWRDEIWPTLAPGIIRHGRLRKSWSLADAGIRSERTGSVMRIQGMAEAAGHGATLHLAVLDEAWRLNDGSRAQAVQPATITVPDSQLWILSTAGTLESVYFRGHVERGRARVAAGLDRAKRASYFEWGLPSGADPDDEALWPDAVPAFGHTISLEQLREKKGQMGADEFRRAHLNQWPLTLIDGAVPLASWEAVRAQPGQVATGRLWVALDTPPRGQGGGGVAVAGDGVVGIESKGVGQRWTVVAARRLWAQWGADRIGGVAVVRGGALHGVGELLEAEGLPVQWYDWARLSTACERFYDHVIAGDAAVAHDTALDAAVRRAQARDRTSGSWVWRPAHPDSSVAVLMAATMAWDLDYRHRHSPVPEPWVSDPGTDADATEESLDRPTYEALLDQY